MQLPDAVSCPLCEARSARFERELDGYSLVRCDGCTFVYLWPRPEREESRDRYADGYRGARSGELVHREAAELMAVYDAEYTPYKRHALRRRLLRIDRQRSIRRMLDFGCGSGHLLGLARGVLDCDTYGIEMHPVGPAGAERFGFTLHAGPLESAPFEPSSFDLAYVAQVFEHLREPRTELRLLRRFLAPGGLLFLELPNYASLAIRLRRDPFHFNRPPGHVNYFGPPQLRRLLSNSGFEVVSARTTALNYRAILGLPAPAASATRNTCARLTTGPQAAADLQIPHLDHRLTLKLAALRGLDTLCGSLGWGAQLEVLARRTP